MRDVEVGACRGRHRGVRRIVPGNECAEAASGFDDAGRLQLTVCAGHGVDGQAQLPGQFTHRRQPGPGRKGPGPDGLDDLTAKLIEQRSIRLSVNLQPLPHLHQLSIPQSRYLGGVRITVLSGAGISAESGVPTFRDDKNGLWARFDPYELSSVQGWLHNPERVWGWYLWRHYLVGTVEPNPGHRAVAAWQNQSEVSVVTQNVDDLHERAGSAPVHHLHGSLFKFRCATCGLPYTGDLPEMPEPALEVEPPTCDCGGLIRPDIVWFGEALPEEPWQHAVAATTNADVLVVVGTSGIVYPAAGLPELALGRGAVVVEVNPEPTPLSSSATITVRESASTALPTLLQRLPALLDSAGLR